MTTSSLIEEAKRLRDPAQWATDRSAREKQLYRGREVAHSLRAAECTELAGPLEALADAMRPIGTSTAG